jgi:hypothetical protein
MSLQAQALELSSDKAALKSRLETLVERKVASDDFVQDIILDRASFESRLASLGGEIRSRPQRPGTFVRKGVPRKLFGEDRG